MANNQPKNAPQKVKQAAQNVQDIKKGVQDSVSAVKNFKTGNWVGAAKDAINVLKNEKFRKHVIISSLISVLIPIIFVVLIGGFYYAIIGKIGDIAKKLVSGTSSSVSKSVKGQEFDEDGKLLITIDKEKFKILKDGLKSSAVDSKASGMNDECIKIFMLAEYATLYPKDVEIMIEITEEEEEIIKKIGLQKLIKSKEDSKFIHTQGCITIKRPEFSNGELSIRPLDEMEKYEKGEEGYTFDLAKNYYAIDKTGCLVIPEKEIVKEIEGKDEVTDKLVQWDDEEKYDWETFNKNNLKSETTTPKLQKIPYKSEMSIYGMPYEFITLLTTFTKCPEYGLEVAKLVIDKTKITINILDDSKTTEARTTQRYKRNTTIDYAAGAKAKILTALVFISDSFDKKIPQVKDRTEEYFNSHLEDRNFEGNYKFLDETIVWDSIIRNNSYDAYHVRRLNTITTQYTSKIQVEEAETWFFKKKTTFEKAEPTDFVTDDTIDPNPEEVNLQVEKFIRSFSFNEAEDTLSTFYGKEEAFKYFIIKIFNPEHRIEGTSIDKFREFLLSNYNTSWMLEAVNKYNDDKIHELYNKDIAFQELPVFGPFREIVLEERKDKLVALENALKCYNGKDPDWKIDSNSYDAIPTFINSVTVDPKQQTAYYISETIYNVSNVGKGEEENYEDFIKLLVKNVGENIEYVYYNSIYGGKTAPCADLINGSEMFFQLLADNDKTANLENVMRFIMYEITGKDFGVKTFKRALFSMKNFGTGDILYDYIRIRENDVLYQFHIGEINTCEYVSANHYKTIPDPAEGYMDFAYGIVLNPPCNDEVFEEFGVTADKVRKYTKAGMEVIELSHEEAERLFERAVDKRRDYVKSIVISDLNEDQINALTIMSYAFGNPGNINEVYHLYKEGKIEEFKSSFKVEGVKVFLETCLGWDAEDVELIYKMFSEGYYECRGRVLDKMDYKKPKFRGLGPVVEMAIMCHKYLRENKFTYAEDENKNPIPTSIPEFATDGKKIVDCAGFVGWVLYEVGYESFAGYEGDYASNHHELIQVPKDQVQPGDIVVIAGKHVEIAAAVENGVVTLVYNCGYNKAIWSEGTDDYPETVTPGDNNYDVILRVP